MIYEDFVVGKVANILKVAISCVFERIHLFFILSLLTEIIYEYSDIVFVCLICYGI